MGMTDPHGAGIATATLPSRRVEGFELRSTDEGESWNKVGAEWPREGNIFWVESEGNVLGGRYDLEAAREKGITVTKGVRISVANDLRKGGNGESPWMP